MAGPLGRLGAEHDSRPRGSRHGILNNELYIGRLVWNRQRYVKHPDTGKRLARINPADDVDHGRGTASQNH